MRNRSRQPPPLESLMGAVCVIDRDQGIRNSLYMLLGTMGVSVVTFSSAEEFLERLAGERPAFLITELSLPGMGGLELKAVLNGKGLHIPAIGLTGEALPAQREEALRLGFLEVVEKPFVYWAVVDRVQHTIGAHC